MILSVVCICLSLTACGETKLTDGQFTIDVTLKGGSGRAGVQSPATLTVEGEKLTATIVWSSPFYEYMIVDGVRYEPIQAEGNATFEIPVVLDQDMKVSACTVAMSEPHVIEYTLYFDRSSVKGA